MLLVGIAAAGAQAARADRAPNFIVILADDLGCGDLSLYDGWVRTPRIDRMAREGMMFTDFHANSSVCSPTRVAFHTGRYQQRYAIDAPLSHSANSNGLGLDAEGHSLPQLLKDAGYSTGLVGKWHLGYAPDQSPEAHGFDYFFGFKAGYIDYYQHTDGGGECVVQCGC